MQDADTIVAISSSIAAPAARMIVRASGPLVGEILSVLAPSANGAGARRCALTFAGLAVPGCWVYRFTAPKSATGEDVAEFHIPGSTLLARMLLEELIRLGARQAEPGEFTARAYFNGRISLSQAEGVAAVIAAQNDRELAAARQLMAGELAQRLMPILDALAETLALVEVGIDFSEEDLSFKSGAQIQKKITAIDNLLASLLHESARLERLSHEPRIVLVGRPNAGKSTLLNALTGHPRAVVSPQAGTTRDAIWIHLALPRGTVRLIDVAGVEAGTDEISRQMQRQAARAVEEADLIVLVRDCTDSRPLPEIARTPDLLVASKTDLRGSIEHDELPVSAFTGESLAQLRERLDTMAFGQVSDSAVLALNTRHVRAVDEARAALSRASQSDGGAEILAMEMREALDALGEILGSVTPDDLLGRIFSSFCIGK
jgi:tRNA modification GTPase